MPRSVPSGWAPYRTGHWSYVQPWGWTWIDDQPWGFAPYHYGRWANSGGRWVWVPPQRDVRPVYAPALVAFVGGIELAATLSASRAARRSAGSRSVRARPTCRPTRPTATITSASTARRRSRTRSSTIAGSARNGTSRPPARTSSTPR